jgi:predicted permease
MIAIFEQVCILIAFCVTGYVMCKTKLLSAEHSKPLSVLLVYVFFPCMSFNTFSAQFNVTYLQQRGALILVSVGLLLVMVVCAKIMTKLLGGDPYTRNVNDYSMTTANIGYMGYPLVEAVFGQNVLLDCMMFGLPMSIYIGTIGYNMLTIGKGQKSIWQKIFTPSLIGILIGCVVGISGIKLPQTVFDIAKMSSNCVAPVSMLLTGMAISEFSIKELVANWKVYIVCAVRLILAPVVAWSLVKLCGLGFALIPATALYAMPCGMNNIVYPKLVGKDCRHGAAIVLVSTVLSMLTIPLCIYFLLS